MPSSTSNRTGFARVVPFALAALALLGLLSTGAFAGSAPALGCAAAAFAALSLALYRRHPAGVRAGLLVGLVLSAAVIPQWLLLLAEALRVRDNGVVIAVAGLLAAVSVLPITMALASGSTLRGMASSRRAWLAAGALVAGTIALLFVLWKAGAKLEAPNALDGTEVHELRFSADGSELTAASEYAANDNVFSVRDGRFVRAERALGIRHLRNAHPAYRSSDGSRALEIGYSKRGATVETLIVRDAGGEVLWSRRLGWQDKLARGNACCSVGAAAFSPDARQLAIAYFGAVYLYDAASGAQVRILEGPTRARGTLFWWWDVLGRA